MAGESCNLDEEEAEILKPSSSSSPSPSPAPAPPPPSPASPSLFLKPPPQDLPAPERLERSDAPVAISAPPKPEEDSPSSPLVQSSNRCLICRKRLGLTSFRCRCGELFCPRHRYSETHDCSFDYKAAGKEQIAKANPLIRAAKIIKI
ncbi:zinc finger AN1 domain-containing stress-associated protein 15-like [Canna indica]|uniref:Zinc finger AN1 domain-containing stress-associated protein 15-like n=1 Tax=Canna indica TaxID=4628 RepID=A0AAQ3JWX4_9LILI|nr:zinc finger AN1 domain-containing stress-associated protein 15-like [Canna indica]